MKALFREYAVLDFVEISKHITNSQIRRISADDNFIRHSDVLCLKASTKGNFYIFIPCRFEDKTFIQAFFKTASLNSNLLEEFDKAKLHQFSSCYNIPSEVFDELFEKFGF